jgi:hypothetical protein
MEIYTIHHRRRWNRKDVWRSAAEARVMEPMSPAELERLGTGRQGDAWFAEVFRVRASGEEEGAYEIHLDGGSCTAEWGAPERASRRLAILRPGVPVRVVLNGKSDHLVERFYGVGDYYFYCRATKNDWERMKTVDLQEDLW